MAYHGSGKGKMTTSSNPNKGGSRGKAMVSPSMSNSKSGSITKSSEMRADAVAKVSNKNPYPGGMS